MAAVEIRLTDFGIMIDSLIVDPANSRQGIATEIIKFLISKYSDQILAVQTASANHAALSLYKKMGFAELKVLEESTTIERVELRRSI